MPELFDHLFIVAFAVGLPVLASTVWYPLIKRSHAQGRPNVFIYAISFGVIVQWVLVLAVFVLWRDRDRSFAAIGFLPPGGLNFWISFAVFAGGLLFLVIQHVMVLQSEDNRRSLMEQFERLRALLPDTRGKLVVFMVASLTAGFCEEVLYRGVLTWYFSNYMPTVAAYAASTAAFGLAHAYQGRKGIAQTAMIGAIFMALMHFSGSIWLSMLLHAAVDVNSGLLGYKLLAPDDGGRRDEIL